MDIWMKRLIGLIAGMALGAVIVSACRAQSDLPSDPPLTATGFSAMNPATNKCGLVAIVFTYKGSDQVVRFDMDHMHGMTVAQLVAYADGAKDTSVYDTCKADEAGKQI
jgi:hypothetical protein